MPRRVYFIESDSGCVRPADSERERLEKEISDLIAGKHHCDVLLMLPGRHVVAMDIPDAAPQPMQAAPESPPAPARRGRPAKPAEEPQP